MAGASGSPPAASAVRGEQEPQVRTEVVKAARWRAARHGLEGDLFEVRDHALRPAPDVVRALLTRLRDDLEDAGEWDEVSALAGQALGRGTSAARQRGVLERTGELDDVVRSLVEETVGASVTA